MKPKNDSKKILVVGATGTVGGATVRELLARGAPVRALVRAKERAAHLDAVELVEGDLANPGLLPPLLEGIHTAFYVSPHEPNEEAIAASFVTACEKLGVRLVFVGVHVDARTSWLRALMRFYLGRLMPTYVPKLRLSEKVRNSNTRPIVLMPTNYFENDEIFRDEILAGAFIQPFERPFNRVAVRDIAVAAARVCLDPSFPPGAYPVVGPASLDGRACAAIWSEALGRPVHYGVDEAAFRAAVVRKARGKKVTDLVSSYAAISKFALPTSKKDLAKTTELLGRPPCSYAAYARDALEAWRAESGSHAA